MLTITNKLTQTVYTQNLILIIAITSYAHNSQMSGNFGDMVNHSEPTIQYGAVQPVGYLDLQLFVNSISISRSIVNNIQNILVYIPSI
jgi:hypothetical protein